LSSGARPQLRTTEFVTTEFDRWEIKEQKVYDRRGELQFRARAA